MAKDKRGDSLYTRWLNGIERVGNALPHPVFLFALLGLGVVALSAVCAALGVSATGELVAGGEMTVTTVQAVSLLTREGLAYMFSHAVDNFTGYAPLGMVLVAMLGVGVAEQSGLMDAALKRAVQVTPGKLITPAIVFLGVMSNIASDAGYVVLIPLGAMVFRACGRHPLAGLAAAFSGVSGGFSANLMVGMLDPMLAGISQTAAGMIDPNYRVSVVGNWYFLLVSTFLITLLGTIVTDRVVEPRLEAFSGQVRGEENSALAVLSERERRGPEPDDLGDAQRREDQPAGPGRRQCEPGCEPGDRQGPDPPGHLRPEDGQLAPDELYGPGRPGPDPGDHPPLPLHGV